MIYVYYALAALLVYFSVKSVLGGIAYLKFFRQSIDAPPADFTPFVSVIAPCRGVDPGMHENLAALTAQDYPLYEVIFAVDDFNDPATAVIGSVSSAAVPATSLIVAEPAVGCSQKVQNLRDAVRHVSSRSEIFVFVDSDTRPTADWLRTLVAPLDNSKIGAATGYRWFISEKPTFASELRSVWNASIASALGPDTDTNFCWGGSMALRRETFERLRISDKWAGSLSDDFTVTRTLRNAGMPIVFVPMALTATVENCSLREMLEFTTRQMKITREYAQNLWILSFIGSGLFTFTMLVSAVLVFAGSRINGLIALGVILIVSILSIGKSYLRLRAVRLVLPRYREHLQRQFWTQNSLWPLTPAVFLYNCIAALLSRRMTWRGIRYELKSATETVIIGGEPAPESSNGL